MSSKSVKVILFIGIIFLTSCDITFKRKMAIDSGVQVKTNSQKENMDNAPKVKPETEFTFSKQDAHIISSYFSDEANAKIRSDMVLHSAISNNKKNKIIVGEVIPHNLQVMPLPLKLERILSPLPLYMIRVLVGTNVIIMNVNSRRIVALIKI